MGLLCAAALASCAFGSESALFAERDATAAFADGALYKLESNEEPESFEIIRFGQVGSAYDLRSAADADETPARTLFITLPETPEDDYIVQIRLTDDTDAVAYGFAWPIGQGAYRVHIAPAAFDASGEQPPAEAYCARMSTYGCVFAEAQAVRRYYLEVLYPAFSTGHVPARYLQMTPWSGEIPQGKH